MRFTFKRFKGIAPAISPRLLNDEFGTVATNIDFESGVLDPIEDDGASVFTLQNSLRRSIYYYNDTNWFEWDDDFVKAVHGPIADDTYDRLYWTGEDYPRMGILSGMVSGGSGYPAASFRLGIPQPSNAPGVSVSGTGTDGAISNSVAYVYTLVSQYGEEGPPSSPSTVVTMTDGQSCTVTMPALDVPSGNYALSTGALKRIYRSNTGSNTTEFQYVGEVAIAATSFVDSNNADDLAELIPSTYWVGPPDDNSSLYPDGPMQGLVAVANGVFAGFAGNRVCFSEAYLPHAWPVAYRISLEEDVVALGTTGNGVVALTDGQPYFISGIDPSAMSAVKIDIAQACINQHSVVDMGEYVLYAGPDGLCAVYANSGNIVTEGILTTKQWTDSYNPTTYRAFRHENTYVAFDGTGGGWVFDPRSDAAVLSTLTASNVRGGYYNPKTGNTFIIVGNTIVEYRGGSGSRTLTWRSKELFLPYPQDMAYIRVDAEAYPVTVRVYLDDTKIADYAISKAGSTYTATVTTPASISPVTSHEPIFRLPGTIGSKWEIEVESANRVNEVAIAQTVEELKSE